MICLTRRNITNNSVMINAKKYNHFFVISKLRRLVRKIKLITVCKISRLVRTKSVCIGASSWSTKIKNLNAYKYLRFEV